MFDQYVFWHSFSYSLGIVVAVGVGWIGYYVVMLIVAVLLDMFAPLEEEKAEKKLLS